MPTVLIVDDEPSLRRLVSRYLSSSFDVTCLEAPDGAAALERLVSTPVDVVLLDLDMPVMDGIKALEIMRQTPALRALPVVLLTGRPIESRIKAAMSLGLATVLLKPFSEEALCARVRPILGMHATAGGIERRQAKLLMLREHQTVLVVESDATRRQLLAAALGRAARVTVAENEFVAMTIASTLAPDVVWLGETSGVWSRDQVQSAMRDLPYRQTVNFVASLPKDQLVAAAASGKYAAVIRRTADGAELETELVRVLDPIAAAHVLLRPDSPLVRSIFGSLSEVGLPITAAPTEISLAGRHAVASAVLNVTGARVVVGVSLPAVGALELADQNGGHGADEASETRALAGLRRAIDAWARLTATSVTLSGLAVEVEPARAQWSDQPPPAIDHRLQSGRHFVTGSGSPLFASLTLRSMLPTTST